jgi:hypothetical protein
MMKLISSEQVSSIIIINGTCSFPPSDGVIFITTLKPHFTVGCQRPGRVEIGKLSEIILKEASGSLEVKALGYKAEGRGFETR